MEHFFEGIKGWASWGEQGRLINIILEKINTKEKINIAEIGVYEGRCTAMWNVELLNKNIQYNYYAIDHFEGSTEHKKNGNLPSYEKTLYNLNLLENFLKNKQIQILKTHSLNACQLFSDDFFDIIYIDASHDYESVKNDIESWLPKVKNGGIICGDDYWRDWPGVIRAVNEKFKKINLAGIGQWWVLVEK